MRYCPTCQRAITLKLTLNDNGTLIETFGACNCGFIFDQTIEVMSVTMGGHTYYEHVNGQCWANSYIPIEFVFVFYKLLAKVNKLFLKTNM